MRNVRSGGLIVFLLLLAPLVSANIFISEVMYNPSGTEANFEWIELFNNESATINLTGFTFESAILSDNAIINSGEYIVLVRNEAGFDEFYGDNNGTWDPNTDGNFRVIEVSFGTGLNNAGEEINFFNQTGITGENITYSDNAEENFTLERYNFNTQSLNSSKEINGTPGAQNSIFDETPPSFTLLNQTLELEIGTILNQNITIIDESEVNISINDTVNFNISQDGQLNNARDLIVGEYNILITAIDAGSNSLVLTANFTIQDTVPPTITGEAENQTLELATGTIVDQHINGTDPQSITVTINDTENFNISATTGQLNNKIDLTIGNYNIIVNVTDQSGNVAQTQATITIQDTTNPTLTDGSNATIELGDDYRSTFTATDLQAVTFSINDSNFTIASNGTLTNEPLLLLGTLNLNVTATDASGNHNDTLFTLIVQDLTPPTFLDTILNRTVAFPATIAEQINASDLQPITYALNNGNFSINSTGFLINSVLLQPNEYVINITATDASSNTNAIILNITVIDNSTPKVVINEPRTDNNRTTIFANFTVTEDVEVSQVFANVTNSTQSTLTELFLSNGFYAGAITTGVTEEGTVTIQAIVNDTSSNLNDSESVTFKLDNVPPLAVFQNTENSTVRSEHTINASVTDTTLAVDTVIFIVSNDSTTLSYTATTREGSTYSFLLSTESLQDGEHNITIWTNDTLNNINNSEQLTLHTDNTGPVITGESQSPSVIVNNESVNINVTVTDTFRNINTVLIESNHTGSTINFSTTAINNTLYSFTIDNSNLENGETIQYRFFASDELGNGNIGTLQTFTVSNRAPKFVGEVPNTTFDEDVFQNNIYNLSEFFSDDDADQLNFTASPIDNIAVIITGSNVSIQPQKNINGEFTVVFTAIDNFSATANSNNVTITITPTNDAPELISNIPDINFTEDEQSISFDLHNFFNETEDQPMTFGVNKISDPLVTPQVNPTSGITFINASENINGQFTVQFFAEDNQNPAQRGVSNVILINITPVNDAPRINESIINLSRTITEDTPVFTIDLTEFEIDVDNESAESIIWAVQNFNGSLLNAQITDEPNDILTITPHADSHGFDTITLNLTDNDNTSAQASFTINITSVNDAPTISTSIPSQSTNDSSNNGLVIDMSQHVNDDRDNNTVLIISATTSNAHYYTALTQVGTNLFIKVKPDIAGSSSLTDTIIVTVSDPEGLSVSQGFTLTINSENDAPPAPVPLNPANASIITDSSKTVTLNWSSVIDPDGNSVQYHIFFGTNGNNETNNPTITTTSNTQLVVSSLVENTTYFWQIAATDGTTNSSRSELQSFSTKFNNVPTILNFTPTILTPSQTANTSETFTVFVQDVDQETLTVTFTDDGSIIQSTNIASNNQVSATFTPITKGNHRIVANVKDPQNNEVNQSWSVTVTRSNQAPTLTSIENQNATQDQELSFTVTGNDADLGDGDVLIYSTNDSRFLTTKNSNTKATLKYTPTNSEVGERTLNITVTDELGLHASQLVTITILDTNDAPMIDSVSPVTSETILVGKRQSQLFQATASDIDGTTPTFEWKANGSVQSTASTFTLQGSSFDTGSFPLVLTVSDGAINDTVTWTVQVTDRPVSKSGSITVSADTSSGVNQATSVIFENNNGKIDFGTQNVDLSNVIDLDAGVFIGNNIVAVNTSMFQTLNKQVVITLKNSGNSFILRSAEFTKDKSKISAQCAICSNINVSSGFVIFTTSSLSSYTSVSNATAFKLTAPSTVSIEVNGSSTIVLQNTGTQSVTNVVATSNNNLILLSTDGNTPDISTQPVTVASGASLAISINNTVQSASNNAGTITISSTEASSITTTVQSTIPSKLVVKEVGFKHNGDNDKAIAGDKISNVNPGSKVKLNIVLENQFEDINIENIEIEYTFKNIDDGDDIDDNDDIKKLKPGEDDRVKFDFFIPDEADEDEYDFIIDINAIDGNNQRIKQQVKFTVEVEKEKHDLRVQNAEVTPKVVSCSRGIELTATVKNYGADDEDEAALEFRSGALGLTIKEDQLELDNDAFDDSSKFTARKTFTLPDNIEPGTYPIDIIAYRDEDKEEDRDIIDLVVERCGSTQSGSQQVSIGQPQVKEFEVTIEKLKIESNYLQFAEDRLLLWLGAIVVLLLVLLVFLLLIAAQKK